jgi:hypothetical protein
MAGRCHIVCFEHLLVLHFLTLLRTLLGAFFVLEIPHRMGLQYFEAISPATIASIVAVLCNRLVTGNDVTGYYR